MKCKRIKSTPKRNKSVYGKDSGSSWNVSPVEEDDQKDSAQYGEGGYCPMKIGDVLKKHRYCVARKLGWGYYSTVWLCKDSELNKYVAIKVSKSGCMETMAAENEIKNLKLIKTMSKNDSERKNIVQLFDSFTITSVNGTHRCLVLEALGSDLLKLIMRNDEGIPQDKVKCIIRQVLVGLDFLHRKCQLVHTDIKPENILVDMDEEDITELAAPKEIREPNLKAGNKSYGHSCKKRAHEQDRSGKESKKLKPEYSGIKPQSRKLSLPAASKTLSGAESESDTAFHVRDIKVKIADLGTALRRSRRDRGVLQTRNYRSLEVLLGSGFSTSADIWSTACMAFELSTGKYLFDPHSGYNYSQNDDHLARIVQLLGKIPNEIALGGIYSQVFFTKTCQLRHGAHLKPRGLCEVLVNQYKWDREEAQEFTSFLLPMLEYDPGCRPTAAECLNHPWLKPK